MRHIGTIPRLEHAQRFTDYLSAIGISAVTEAQGAEWSIWVRDEDLKDQSREELEKFLQEPDGEHFRTLAAKAQAERELKEAAPITAEPVQEVRRQPLTMRDVTRRAPLTMTIVLLCVFVGLASQLGQNLRSSTFECLAFCNPQHLSDQAWEPAEHGTTDILRGEVWRLVTPTFIHFGIAHIGINLFFLFRIGWIYENRNRTVRMGLVLLICAIVGNLGQFYCESWPLFGGLSGAVSGLVAYTGLRISLGHDDWPPIAPIAILLMLLAIGLAGGVDQLTNEALGNDVKIANWSQMFGIVTGCVLAVVLPASSSGIRQNS